MKKHTINSTQSQTCQQYKSKFKSTENWLLAAFILFALFLQGAFAASSVDRWSSAIVYSGNSTVSSGVPVSSCHVLTNEHAVRHHQNVVVATEGKKHSARVIDVDQKHDLALVKLSTCPIKSYAKIATAQPVKGEKLTSIYYRFGLVFNKMVKSTGSFLGYLDITTEEDKEMLSMVIDDRNPRKGASGGGVITQNGLVSVIFGITDEQNSHKTFAVDYFSLKNFLKKNNI